MFVASEGDEELVEEEWEPSRLTLAGADEEEVLVALEGETEIVVVTVVGETASFAFPPRVERPSKVTRAFSETQERLAELKRAMILLALSGIEKLVEEPEISREIESPRVTFVRLASVKEAVVQPVEEASVHVDPVNPLVQIQAQELLSRTEVPPFWQAVEGSAVHFSTSDKVVPVAVLALLKTRSSRGTTIAAATITNRPNKSKRNNQQGIPQHLRPFFCRFPFLSSGLGSALFGS